MILFSENKKVSVYRGINFEIRSSWILISVPSFRHQNHLLNKRSILAKLISTCLRVNKYLWRIYKSKN